jgi:hypothetical protein
MWFSNPRDPLSAKKAFGKLEIISSNFTKIIMTEQKQLISGKEFQEIVRQDFSKNSKDGFVTSEAVISIYCSIFPERLIKGITLKT